MRFGRIQPGVLLAGVVLVGMTVAAQATEISVKDNFVARYKRRATISTQ